MQRFVEYTALPNERKLFAMLRELDAMPGVLVVFNHPVWDLHKVGDAVHMREVLKFISEGLSNKQGALRMNISPRTFESHRAEAMRKLGARNTAELVRVALLSQFG